MLDIGKDGVSAAKCCFSHTILPHYIDDNQPPTKRKPFSTILSQPFNHTLEIIAPESSSAILQAAISKANSKQQYARVHLKLKEILTGDFFNHYIKTGNILLLSQGRPGTDNTISLADGVLRLELDRATYERAGLVGQPVRDPRPGRPHVGSRFAVALNLRLPAMVAGKKGFARLLWAADNVFPDALTWLFADLQNPTQQQDAVIGAFQPFVYAVDAQEVRLADVLVPVLPQKMDSAAAAAAAATDVVATAAARNEATELLEWLNLVFLDSPRIKRGDRERTDSYISRYDLPEFGDGGKAKPADLVRLRWHGFLSAAFVAKICTTAIKATAEEGWFAMRVEGFGGQSYTTLKLEDTAMTWECE
ncbi:hypothetical protein MBLNU459_g6942t1 [Dothideomycetes sp. NU459]